MTVRIEGLETILANIKNIVPAETAKMNSRLLFAGDIVEESIQKQASLTDHTLEDLAALGHPYSWRYPKNYGPHGDDSLVHIQSGRLFSSIKTNENLGIVKSQVEIGVSESDVPYIEDLITGNGAQRPRNFIGHGFLNAKERVIGILSGRK